MIFAALQKVEYRQMLLALTHQTAPVDTRAVFQQTAHLVHPDQRIAPGELPAPLPCQPAGIVPDDCLALVCVSKLGGVRQSDGFALEH